jgi:outer membrane lipoprotein-sorting protein
MGRGGDDSGSSADPSSKLLELASGTHTVRVASDGPDKQKVSLLDKAAEYSVIHNGDELWAYDSASNEAYHTKAPPPRAAEKGTKDRSEDVPATPKELADEALKASDDTTSVTVDGTAQVAGRDAYKLLIKPKASGSTVGAISIAVDSKTGLPLKFTLTPASGGAAVVDAGFTKVDFAKPAASTFDFTRRRARRSPRATSRSRRRTAAAPEKAQPKGGEELGKEFEGLKVIGEGWNSIARLRHRRRGRLPSEGSGGGDAGRRLPRLAGRQGQRQVRLGHGLLDPPGQRPDHGRRQGLRRRGHEGRAGEGGQRGEVKR